MGTVLSIRLADEEKATLQRAATEEGLTLSEFIRRAAMFAATPVVPVSAAQCDHFTTAGALVTVACGACGLLDLKTLEEAASNGTR